MSENKIKEQVWREIEAEAEALERKVEENEELSSVEMPEGSFDDLMARIKAAENEKSNVKPLRIRKRALLAVALAAVLLVAASVGTSGAKLFVPKVENRGEGGELSITIDSNIDDIQVEEITEEEAYDEIEEQLGILALRLGYKPKGMELETVSVLEDMGEAWMEFYYQDHILTVYENKQNDSASFGTQPDGMEIDTAEIFHLGKEVSISEINKGNDEIFYRTEFEYANAYYYVTCDIELEEFKSILMGIIFDTM